jgi:3-oxoacyl-[acyl-carrier protein] reductase
MRQVDYHFEGTTHLISGGSRGIGRAIVMALARAGANVAFTYVKDGGAAAAVAEEAGTGAGRIVAIQADARDGAGATALVERVESEVGELTGLVNNAGIRQDRTAFQMSAEEWGSVVHTNLSGSFFLAQAALRKLIRRERGKVVNMSSVSGLVGIEGQANYAASKAGMIAYTRCLAREVARFNVQVNAVAPGFVSTEMVDSLAEKVKADHVKRIPARRFGHANEIAAAVLFLLSDASNYINGETLVIDGGLSS